RTPATVEHQDQSQRDRRFACGHGDDEESEDLSLQITAISSKGNQIDRHSLQHHLSREEHDDEIASGQKSNDSQAEEDRSHGQIVIDSGQRVHLIPSGRRPAIAIAPIVATRSSVPPISTGIKYWVYNTAPSEATFSAGREAACPADGIG